MTPDFHNWAARHGVSPAACVELAAMLGASDPVTIADGHGEAYAQSLVRLEAPYMGCTLWRNNVGVLPDRNDRPVRYGLANESPKLNDRLKSSDLVGWRRLLITPAHVGRTIAQFLCREMKPPGWQYRGVEREPAQLRWIELVTASGGDAAFATGAGTL